MINPDNIWVGKVVNPDNLDFRVVVINKNVNTNLGYGLAYIKKSFMHTHVQPVIAYIVARSAAYGWLVVPLTVSLHSHSLQFPPVDRIEFLVVQSKSLDQAHL